MTNNWIAPDFSLLDLFIPKQVEVHVKWFVSQNDTSIDNNIYFSFLDPNMRIVLGAAIFVFICAAIIHIVLSRYSQPSNNLSLKLKAKILVFAQILTGSALFASSINGVLFAPHFVASSNQITFLMMELVAGILFITRSYVYLACFLTLIIFSAITIDYGLVSSFEYLNIVGLISLFSLSYLALRSSKKNKRTDLLDKESLIMTGLTFYRVTLGIALVILGLSEKILNPELAIDFVNQYPDFNFMRVIGIDFSDRLFIFCGGISEILFGVIYITGFVPRINTIALAFFLVASNSFFAFTGEMDKALMELVGHLPLLSGAIIIIFLGGGYNFSELRNRVKFKVNLPRLNTKEGHTINSVK